MGEVSPVVVWPIALSVEASRFLLLAKPTRIIVQSSAVRARTDKLREGQLMALWVQERFSVQIDVAGPFAVYEANGPRGRAYDDAETMPKMWSRQFALCTRGQTFRMPSTHRDFASFGVVEDANGDWRVRKCPHLGTFSGYRDAMLSLCHMMCGPTLNQPTMLDGEMILGNIEKSKAWLNQYASGCTEEEVQQRAMAR